MMRRRDFVSMIGGGAVTANSVLQAVGAPSDAGTQILLPSLPCAVPLPEAVLFAFDDRAFPFRHSLEILLRKGSDPRVVLRHGPLGSHDEVAPYYGSVIRIGDTFHMWYTGNYGPLESTVGYMRLYCFLCYATSKDGVNWEKPELGLVEYKGSRKNNICELAEPTLWSTAAVLYDPEDPDPNRRFKIAYEANPLSDNHGNRFCVAFSPDGLHWKRSPKNPVGPFLEMTGVTKFRGLYYVNGQGVFTGSGRARARRLDTFVSEDFEHWSPCSALGLDRASDLVGPSTATNFVEGEQVHLGAALWNRSNVLIGIYGQWHGHFSGDHLHVVMDLGLALSHDALHFHEPIPGFRFILARGQPESVLGVAPALVQGQGMENFGDQTLYWYGPWHGTGGAGVHMVTWERDRLGALHPFAPQFARVISCPLQVVKGKARLFINASGLGPHCTLRVGLVTEGFRSLPGYSEADSAVLGDDGLRIPVRWKSGEALPASAAPFRIDIRFEGVRPEDGAFHAAYVTAA